MKTTHHRIYTCRPQPDGTMAHDLHLTTTIQCTTGPDENVHIPSLLEDMLTHCADNTKEVPISRHIYRLTTLQRLPIGATYLDFRDPSTIKTRDGTELDNPFVISTERPDIPTAHQCIYCRSQQDAAGPCHSCQSPTLRTSS